MITNRDVLDIWRELPQSAKVQVINKFGLVGKNPVDFLRETDIKKYISNRFISSDKVVTK
jgi:hypothetical protein